MKYLKIFALAIIFLYSAGASAQVRVLDHIAPFPGGSYPTHIDSLGYGGYRVAKDTFERNSITRSRRKMGMAVYTQSDGVLWFLNDSTGQNKWIKFTTSNLTDTSSGANRVLTTAMYANPSWLTSLAWSKITGAPTTAGLYGITDVYTKTQSDANYGTIQQQNSNTTNITNLGTRIATDSTGFASGINSNATNIANLATRMVNDSIGFVAGINAGGGAGLSTRISNDSTNTAGKVSLTGSYTNPAWITSLAYSKITGAPVMDTSSQAGVLTIARFNVDSAALRGLINSNTTSITSNTSNITANTTAITNKADKSTTLTINGLTQDLSTNRSWTIAGGGGSTDTSLLHNEITTNQNLISTKQRIGDFSEKAPYSQPYAFTAVNQAALPMWYDGVRATEYKDTLILVAGWNAGQDYDSVYQSSDGGLTWQFRSHNGNGATHAAPLIKHTDGYYYLIGGDGYGTAQQRANVYRTADFKTYQLMNSNSPFRNRILHEGVSFHDSLFVGGGQYYTAAAADSLYKDLWKSGDGGVTWQLVSNNLPFMGENLVGALNVYNGEIIKAGGGIYDTSAVKMPSYQDSTVWSTRDGVNWTNRGKINFRGGHYMNTFVWDGKLWLEGGSNSNSSNYNTDSVFYMDRGYNWHRFQGPNRPLANHAAATVVYHNKPYIIEGNTTNKVWSLDYSNIVYNEKMVRQDSMSTEHMLPSYGQGYFVFDTIPGAGGVNEMLFKNTIGNHIINWENGNSNLQFINDGTNTVFKMYGNGDFHASRYLDAQYLIGHSGTSLVAPYFGTYYSTQLQVQTNYPGIGLIGINQNMIMGLEDSVIGFRQETGPNDGIRYKFNIKSGQGKYLYDPTNHAQIGATQKVANHMEPSAALEVQSTVGGFLGPRMTTAQIAALPVGRVRTVSITSGGSGYTNGTYNSITLYGGAWTTPAQFNVTVTGGSVTSMTVYSYGVGYVIGDVLTDVYNNIGGSLTGGGGFSAVVTGVSEEGLEVYDLTVEAKKVYNGNAWKTISTGAGSTTILPYKNIAIGSALNTVTSDTLIKGDTVNHTLLLGTIVPESTIGDTIVYMGTSITKGYNFVGTPDTVLRWTTFATSKLKGFGFSEYNLGVPASVMNEQIGNIPVKTPKKRFLVMEYTANELNRDYDSVRFRGDLLAFVDTALARGWQGNQIIMVSCWFFEYNYIGSLAHQQQYNRALQQMATSVGATYVDEYDQVISDPNYAWAYVNHDLHPDYNQSELAAEVFASKVQAIFNPTSSDRQVTNGTAKFSKIQLKNIGNVLSPQILGIDSAGVLGATNTLPATMRTQGFTYLSVWSGIVNDITTAHTIDQTNLGKQIEMNNSAANTVTVPTDAVLNAPIGTVVYVFQRGTGSTTIAASNGVSLLNAHSNVLYAQYSTVVLTKTGPNEWEAAGDFK